MILMFNYRLTTWGGSTLVCTICILTLMLLKKKCKREELVWVRPPHVIRGNLFNSILAAVLISQAVGLWEKIDSTISVVFDWRFISREPKEKAPEFNQSHPGRDIFIRNGVGKRRRWNELYETVEMPFSVRNVPNNVEYEYVLRPRLARLVGGTPCRVRCGGCMINQRKKT